jgi:hypothetical protein
VAAGTHFEDFWFPPGYEMPSGQTGPLSRGTIVNETDLPDHVVQEVVGTYIEANASVLGLSPGQRSFQTYANEGSLLARRKFEVPKNIMEEIALARDIAERDDDVGATIGTMLAVAFEGGMQNTHPDEVTVALYDEVAKHANLDYVFPDMYRELLIASSVTTVSLYVREAVQFQPDGADRQRTRQMAVPLIGILPAEQVHVLDNDMFRRGTLAYRPATAAEENFLTEYFSDKTTEGRKAQMRKQDPVLTALVTDMIELPPMMLHTPMMDVEDPPIGNKVFVLNPRMVSRVTLPKGAAKYPRPLLTRNFALLEAKRLLNLMDFALLQGGSNFLVVAKKGTDQLPAIDEEVQNLRDQIGRASRAGVIVGDHRLSIEVITPDLSELLSPQKRRLLGRKLAMALLRVPESGVEDPGQEGMRAEVELASRVITADRRLLKRHVEGVIYEEVAKRNPGDFPKGGAKIWFPKIVLQGTQYFTDFVLKLRDRGDISRQSTVEAGGFDYKAEVQQRKREKAAGDDRALTPPPVPFTGQPGGGGGPNDNGGGRPPGGSPANGRPGSQPSRTTQDPARPTRQIARNAGETVRAWYEDGMGTYRAGELTHAVLEQFDSSRKIGRMTRFELTALHRVEDGEWDIFANGSLIVVPVNPEYEIEGVKAVRLTETVTMLVGTTADQQAVMARALCFRAPDFDALKAEEMALEWGFATRPELEEPESDND